MCHIVVLCSLAPYFAAMLSSKLAWQRACFYFGPFRRCTFGVLLLFCLRVRRAQRYWRIFPACPSCSPPFTPPPPLGAYRLLQPPSSLAAYCLPSTLGCLRCSDGKRLPVERNVAVYNGTVSRRRALAAPAICLLPYGGNDLLLHCISSFTVTERFSGVKNSSWRVRGLGRYAVNGQRKRTVLVNGGRRGAAERAEG